MILAEIAIGVGANLATYMLQHQGKRLQNTKFGKRLAVAGLLDLSFEQQLSRACESSAVLLFGIIKSEDVERIADFLSTPLIQQEITSSIFDGEPLDVSGIQDALADCFNLPRDVERRSWPNGIDPAALVASYVDALTREIQRSDSPAIALLSAQAKSIAADVRIIKAKQDSYPDLIEKVSRKGIRKTGESEWEAFEKKYLSHLGARCGKMTTPGVADLHGVKQKLSVAYISLNVRTGSKAEPVGAEDYLKDHTHILIRGPAGSGKTTLLSYIAWSCCTDRDEDNIWYGGIPFFIRLRSVAHSEPGAPKVENFVRYSVDEANWVVATPTGWIEEVLSSRRKAIVMIDGVDELPSTRRVDFWSWLETFCELYPNTRVVVTSRVLPGSTPRAGGKQSESWNPPKVFSEVSLEEMSDKDISRFVEHWHNAVDPSKLDEEETAELDKARSSLPKKLSDPANRRIRDLCSTPLLCAMVCVLHWREEGYLPHQRVEIYDKCCEMLIEARDKKRKIETSTPSIRALSKNDKQRILQRLAFEMMHCQSDGDEKEKAAYRVEIEREKALRWIEPWIQAFQRVEAREATAKQVLDYLIERTGLLREPATGLVDFPHRTFQEYLAACAAGADGKEDLLAKNADDDQWHETIMLAAGTPTGGVPFGHALIVALVRRAERHTSEKPRSQRIKKTCFALALGCVDNLRQPDPAVRELVLSKISEIVPPANDSDAKILSFAGDAAVPHLSYERWKDESTTIRASCALALRLIGTDQALRSLSDGYIEDRREAVLAQICKSGLVPFDKIPAVNEYVALEGVLPPYAIVSDISLCINIAGLKRMNLSSPSIQNLDRLGELKELENLTIEGLEASVLCKISWPPQIKELNLVGYMHTDLKWLGRLDTLVSFSVHIAPHISDLSWLRQMPNLQKLAINDTKIACLAEIGLLTSLRVLSIDRCAEVNDLSPLSGLKSITAIKITRCAVSNLEVIREFDKLRVCELGNFPILTSIDSIFLQPSLEVLRLNRFSSILSLDAIAASSIEKLSLSYASSLKSASALNSMVRLKELTIHSCGINWSNLRIDSNSLRAIHIREANALRDLFAFSNLPKLTLLHLVDCKKLTDISALSSHQALAKLRLALLPKIDDISSLSSLHGLEQIGLFTLPVEDIEVLGRLEKLEQITVSNCVDLRSIEGLEACASLKHITITHCPLIRDLSPLTSCTKLESISIAGPYQKEIKMPETLHPKIAMEGRGHRWYMDDPDGQYVIYEDGSVFRYSKFMYDEDAFRFALETSLS